MKRFEMVFPKMLRILGVVVVGCLLTSSAPADDLADIRRRGVLRHLGVTCANFMIDFQFCLSEESIDVQDKRLKNPDR